MQPWLRGDPFARGAKPLKSVLQGEKMTISRSELHDGDELLAVATRLNRYWDPHLSRRTVKLRPGEYCVSSTDEMLVTVVASSLAVCVRDRTKRILGMSHFMLPTMGLSRLDRQGLELAKSCGHAALAKLLQDIYSYGCQEESLEAVLVSGGEIWPQKRQCTHDSLAFAREYLGAHGVELLGEFVGGPYPKKIYFNLEDTMPYVRVLYNYSQTLKEREDAYLKSLRMEFLLGQRKTSMNFNS